MLQRMNELAVQAANGTNSKSDRDAIQAEIEQLTTEVDRVAETTKFNETYLLKGDQTQAAKTINLAAHDAGLKGTLVDNGDGTYSENTTPIYLNNSSYQNWFNNFGANEGGEFYLIDRSYVKLRNITLAYTLPKSIVSKIYLSDVTLSLFCNNVFTWTAKGNKYVDPEGSTVGNDLSGMFGELYVNPACRMFGFNVGLKF